MVLAKTLDSWGHNLFASLPKTGMQYRSVPHRALFLLCSRLMNFMEQNLDPPTSRSKQFFWRSHGEGCLPQLSAERWLRVVHCSPRSEPRGWPGAREARGGRCSQLLCRRETLNKELCSPATGFIIVRFTGDVFLFCFSLQLQSSFLSERKFSCLASSEASVSFLPAPALGSPSCADLPWWGASGPGLCTAPSYTSSNVFPSAGK